MNGKQSVFREPEKKWQPRNLQAALIFAKAKPFHLPPPSKTRPVFAETLAQRKEREDQERDIRIKEREEESVKAQRRAFKRKEKAKIAQKASKVKKRSKTRNMWMAKHLKRLAKISGMPKPSTEEIKAAKRAYKAGLISI